MEVGASRPAVSSSSSSSSASSSSMEASPEAVLLLAKIGSMFVLGFGSLLLGSLPLIIGRCRSNKCEHRRPIGSVSSASTTLTSSSSLTDASKQPDHASPQGLLTSLLLCFGGGVLLFTTFLHLAPEVRDSIRQQQERGQLFDLGELSLADLLFCAGFFLVYLVEETVHAALTDKPDSSGALLYRTVSVRRGGPPAANNNNPTVHRNNHINNSINNNINNNISSSCSSNASNHNNVLMEQRDKERQLQRHHHHSPHPHQQQHQQLQNSSASSAALQHQQHQPISRGVWRSESSDPEEEEEEMSIKSKDVNRPCQPGKHGSLLLVAPRLLDTSCELGLAESQQQPVLGPQHQQPHHHHHHHHHHSQHEMNSMRSLLTVLALSFHAIFEGLTVGLEPALGSVLYLAAAIATHKLVISFCVGMELYVAGASRRSILGYLSVFAMVTPLGIAIGLGLGLGQLRSGPAGQDAAGGGSLGPTPTILQAMAAGTLLYVVFFEVLARERANEKSGLLQLSAIFLGFLIMLGLQLVTAHTHDHGHSHNHDHSHEEVNDRQKNNYLIDAAIEQVTNKVVDVLSTSLT